MHFNENLSRKQAQSNDGSFRYSIEYKRSKEGSCSIRNIPVNMTYNYVAELMRVLEDIIYSRITPAQTPQIPPPLSSTFFHPDKSEAIKAHHTRFAKFSDTLE